MGCAYYPCSINSNRDGKKWLIKRRKKARRNTENNMKLTPQQLDAWRVIPRMLILTYMICFYLVITWFMDLPDPNNAQAAFTSTMIGAGAAWFGLYVNGKSNASK